MSQRAAVHDFIPPVVYTTITGTFSLVNNVAEQDLYIFIARNTIIEVELDMNLLTQLNTVREYAMIDAANYRQLSQKIFPSDFDTNTKAVLLNYVQKNVLYKITLQAAVAEGAARNIPYRIRIGV